jgi:SAM-dependent methyltransferase
MKDVHSIVFNILKISDKKGMLLDVAGGDGGFALALRDSGWQTVSCDRYSLPKDTTMFIRADINISLPFRSDRFQTVTCIESLQYLENYKRLFSEFARVLQKGGRLIVTIPNILNYSSRLFFLNRGYFKYFKPFKTTKLGREWDKIVYTPISFVEIFQLLNCNSFDIEFLNASGHRYRELPLFLLNKGLHRLWVFLSKKQHPLYELLSSREVLLGDHLIITARKVD